jgi:hypothetical protein
MSGGHGTRLTVLLRTELARSTGRPATRRMRPIEARPLSVTSRATTDSLSDLGAIVLKLAEMYPDRR